MKKVVISALKIIIPLGLGLYLTWFFIHNLSDAKLENLKQAFFNADYTYMFLGMLIMLSSHVSRAYRWKYMLEPLGTKPNFWIMYHSIMIGYLINLTIPRSGELARAGYYTKYEKDAAVGKVFGTIIVERVIDMIMLGIVFGITLYLQKDVDAFNAITEAGETKSTFPIWGYFIIIGIITIVTIVVFKVKKIKEKVFSLIKGVLEGVKTIFKLKQRVAYILHTLFIWLCYLGIIWVYSYALPETSNLSINAVFAAFFVGAVAISATPGGIGLYPFMVAAVLTELYAIENAGSFSMLAWATLTVFTIVFGLISLFILPFIGKKQE